MMLSRGLIILCDTLGSLRKSVVSDIWTSGHEVLRRLFKHWHTYEVIDNVASQLESLKNISTPAQRSQIGLEST